MSVMIVEHEFLHVKVKLFTDLRCACKAQVVELVET